MKSTSPIECPYCECDLENSADEAEHLSSCRKQLHADIFLAISNGRKVENDGDGHKLAVSKTADGEFLVRGARQLTPDRGRFFETAEEAVDLFLDTIENQHKGKQWTL